MDKTIKGVPSTNRAITNALLQLRQRFMEHGGSIIQITLDKNANEALRNEICVPEACGKMLFGIVVGKV